MLQKRPDYWNSFRKEYQQLREQHNSYFEAYTDGSKCEQKVAAATFYPKDPDDPRTIRLREGSSVFNAELEGMLLALKKFLILTKTYKKFIIYTDSFSAVESLRGKTFRTKNIKRFYNLLKKLPPQIQIITALIPLHVDITGSERADRLAKAALTSRLAACSHVCWSDLKPKVNVYIDTICQELRNSETTNLKESLCNTTKPLYPKQECHDQTPNRSHMDNAQLSA